MAGEQLAPPRSVLVSLTLLALSWAAEIVTSVHFGVLKVSDSFFVAIAVFAVASWLVLFGLYKAKNWLRILAILVAILSFMDWPEAVAELSSRNHRVVYLGLGIVQSIAVVLLFTPAANRWYRPNNSSKPTQLRGAA